MTSWRAIGIGLAVLLVGSVLGIVVPGVGQLGATAIAGGVAGYVAGGGLRRGFWHGALVGAGPAIVIVLGIVVAILVLHLAFRPVGMLADLAGFSSAGPVFTIGAFGAIIAIVVATFVLVSGVCGAIGGGLKGV